MDRKASWLAGLALGLGLCPVLSPTPGRADDLVWRPAYSPRPAPSAQPASSSRASTARVTYRGQEPDPEPLYGSRAPLRPTDPPRVQLGAPIMAASLDRPIPETFPYVPAPADFERPLARTSYQDSGRNIVQVQGPPDVPPPPPPPPGGGVAPGTEPYNSGIPVDRPVNRSWWDGCREFFGFGHCGANGRNALQSDHAFDIFASPVTNPFYNEDPRALTELRPIFIYQTLPGGNPRVAGGNAEFFGTQARIAFTDRLSLVMNKLGGVRLDPDNPAFADNQTGFAEVWLGPKYTFVRNDCTNTVAAAGVNFQLPVGQDTVYQDTGNLSLAPYVSVAQSFGRTSYGTFNFMGTAAYAFAVDNNRSDSLNVGLHFDFDVANLNKFYPLIEINWVQYTGNGKARPLDFEGADLANLGASDVSGSGMVTVAAGTRYKFSERVQVGIASEWAVVGRDDLQDFRLTFDLIFRY